MQNKNKEGSDKKMAMTKEELITVIKANSGLSEEHLAELAEKIKGSMIEEFNEKLAELTKKQDNKMKEVHLEDEKNKGPKWKNFGEQLHAIMQQSPSYRPS